jgi:hypothetical protein
MAISLGDLNDSLSLRERVGVRVVRAAPYCRTASI